MIAGCYSGQRPITKVAGHHVQRGQGGGPATLNWQEYLTPDNRSLRWIRDNASPNFDT